MATTIHHLNCVDIQSPGYGAAVGHCMLLEHTDRLVLIDTGTGLLDAARPDERMGRQLIELTGFRFDEQQTAKRQIEALGLDPGKVTDIVLSHLDPDHTGGLADFPQATVHVSEEEYEAFKHGNLRYLPAHLSHQPPIRTYAAVPDTWLGLEARRLDISLEPDLFLVPLFGHTAGHCGVVISTPGISIFYVGDAYYLREELRNPRHPVTNLARMRAENDNLRLDSLGKISKLIYENPALVIFGYHDPAEFAKFNQRKVL
ncbi:MBL fold metallo-hydrolase [Pedobacter sp. SYP-B3415]|uniref:MBL fold metallo-hydrolase n=1 Tax=Pedobacter sp. SYP-B3415 TaxID=2496641 RepID=UPI00101C12A0|nr:MBL fold metallo-hydrolase [Pedobacter sp. SYP-B3415]